MAACVADFLAHAVAHAVELVAGGGASVVAPAGQAISAVVGVGDALALGVGGFGEV